MKIQERFMKTNMLMVLLALGTFALIVGAVLLVNASSTKSFFEVREEVFTIQQEIGSEVTSNTDWAQIDQKINKDDFYLYVTDGTEAVYTSKVLADYDFDMLNDLQGKSGVFYHKNNVVITVSKMKNNTFYNVYAVEQRTKHTFGPLGDDIYFFFRFILISMIAVLAILMLSYIFSKRIVKRIMEPLNMLISSAKRIEMDDFSTFIRYNGEEEFEMLCTSFNNMQLHLQQEKEKNMAYEQARINMVAGISHDLRTPLTSIKGYVKGMLEGVANTPEKQKQYLTTVYKKSLSMESLLERLLYFSKLETGNLPNIPVKVDLGEMLASYVDEIGMDLEQKRIRVLLEHDEACPVYVDINQMLRVFDNLFHNTVKYARVENICIRIKTEVLEDKRVRMTFHDNGVGVSREKLPHIFKLFYRGDKARSSKNADGSGLGLYIVKYVVETQNGRVYAENDNGFKVVITLPLREE